MTKYYPYGVSLSKGQLEKLSRAYNNNSAITIRLTRNELSGPHDTTKKRIYLYSKFGANHLQMPHLLNFAQFCHMS